MEKKMVVDTKLDIIGYMEVVSEISNAYFNEDGEYQPHIGLIKAMASFSNHCVKSCKFDDEFSGNISNVLDIGKIIQDEEFIEVFNESLVVERVQLDFANAFRDALDIVNTNKTSINSIILKLKKLVNETTNSISAAMTPENIELLGKLKEMMESGNFTVDKFIESYGDSEMFKRLLASKEKDKG